MAVNPKKLLEEITQDEEKKLAALEKHIDSVLQESFDGGSAYVNISSDFYSLRKPAQNNLFQRYRKQGWTSIRIESDQREGSYLVFEYKPQKQSHRSSFCDR